MAQLISGTESPLRIIWPTTAGTMEDMGTTICRHLRHLLRRHRHRRRYTTWCITTMESGRSRSELRSWVE